MKAAVSFIIIRMKEKPSLKKKKKRTGKMEIFLSDIGGWFDKC